MAAVESPGWGLRWNSADDPVQTPAMAGMEGEGGQYRMSDPLAYLVGELVLFTRKVFRLPEGAT